MSSAEVLSQSHVLNYDPSTVTGAVVWGVAAGVITSAFLLLLSQAFNKIVIPWYQSLVFNGVDLEGKWVSKKVYQNGIAYNYSLVLKQNAHTLSGSMTIAKTGSPASSLGGQLGDYVQGFEVSGTTWEGFVTINMISDDRRSLSFATSLLQVRDRGQSLVGHMAYRSSQVDEVDSEDITWNRT